MVIVKEKNIQDQKSSASSIVVVMNRVRIEDQKVIGSAAIEFLFDHNKKKTFNEAKKSIEKIFQGTISACSGGEYNKEDIKEAAQHAIKYWRKSATNPYLTTLLWTKTDNLEDMNLQLATQQDETLRLMARIFMDITQDILKDLHYCPDIFVHDKLWEILRSKLAQLLRDDIIGVQVHYFAITQEIMYKPVNHGIETIREGLKLFYDKNDFKLRNIASSYLRGIGYGYTKKIGLSVHDEFLRRIILRKKQGEWNLTHDPRTVIDWMIAELHGLLGHYHKMMLRED